MNRENEKGLKGGRLVHIAKICSVKGGNHSYEPDRTSGTETALLIISPASMTTRSVQLRKWVFGFACTRHVPSDMKLVSDFRSEVGGVHVANDENILSLRTGLMLARTGFMEKFIVLFYMVC